MMNVRRLLSGGGLLLGLLLFLSINVLTNAGLSGWRLDLTQAKLFTLSPGTRNILSELKEPQTLRFYFSEKQFSGVPPILNYGNRVRDILQEYAARSKGQIKLVVTDPEPFSESEDQAVGYGLTQIPVNRTGSIGYFGLVGTNAADDQQVIPLFHPDREQALEYDLTKLVHNLAHPKKRAIGVVSKLPVMGALPIPGQGGASGWAIMDSLKEVFEVKDLGGEITAIDPEIDTLLLIHPKALTDTALYAIDQFVLKGGKAIVFVDPLAEQDAQSPNAANPMAMPPVSSSIPKLFDQWGVRMAEDKIVGDIEAAIRVQNPGGGRGATEIEYLPWLQLAQKNLNRDEFITNQLDNINIGSAGALEPKEGATTTFTPLVFAGAQSMMIERDLILFQRNPAVLLEQFKPGNKQLTLAARIRGKAKTAFPQGRPPVAPGAGGEQAANTPDPDFIAESKNPINVLVVSDTDLLSDRFWVQVQNLLGQRIAIPLADNANFLINAIDNLGGNDDLISLRSRKRATRPFLRVEGLRRDAEAQFRNEQRGLQQKLDDLDARLQELQKQREDGGKNLLLSPEQRKEIEQFRQEQVKTRKDLRAVQRNLDRNIERLGSVLKFLNIALVPLLIGLAAIGVGLLGAARRAPARQTKS
jgi:ABC-type uncharacterized transport system involved in gliding motility auxiliary subunit